ncbi:MAG: transketolase [Candidatus Thorarchaeota archaeon]
MTAPQDLQNRAINAIRFLSADAIQTARSGHPGMCMGAAALTYTVWTRHLKHNPRNPNWPDRDRFVLSGGHGSMLLYSVLYLTGYDITLDQIKRFRQWNSGTPGHPEYGKTAGVEVTTGPLGQGVGNAVGMAIAEAHLAAVFNRPGHDIIDHYTYAVVTDGDLMEGISSEAASLAGHLKLGKLILLYDDNDISIDGSTDITFTEDVAARFEAQGWHVQVVKNGNDVEEVDSAIRTAKADDRPSLIICKTHIGYGFPTIQNSEKSHGAPPGEEELIGAKRRLGWPTEPWFYVPDDVLRHFREAVSQGQKAEDDWKKRLEAYKSEYPELAEELERRLDGRLPEGWENLIPTFEPDEKGMPTRSASSQVINALAPTLTELIGGSADLTHSNKTWMECTTAFQADSRTGRNIHYGVREHAMGAIVNGMAVHGGLKPFCGTFFIFSDYMRTPIRLSAMSHYPSIWVFSHDSIGLGEDGPTHQPVEQLASLRAMPGLSVIRPADANEVAEAWKVALSRTDRPTALLFTRQTVPVIDRRKYGSAEGLRHGAYVLADLGDGPPEIVLMASGSEVHITLEAGEQLAAEGIGVRVVSFPSWDLFEEQTQEYRDSVLPPRVRRRLAVEAGVSMGWEKWIGPEGRMISMEEYGRSAPYSVLFEKFGFTVDNVVKQAKGLLKR